MNAKRSVLGIGAMCLALMAGCAANGAEFEGADSEGVATSAAALAVHDWKSAGTIGVRMYGFDVAYHGSTAYAVFATQTDVRWTQLGSNGRWSEPLVVPGLSGSLGISLASFGGKLYLAVRDWRTHMLRFDPTTKSWSAPSPLPFESVSVPAMVVHGDRLFLVAPDPYYSARLWSTSMGADGTFAPVQWTGLRGHDPSIASFGGALHLAYSAYDDVNPYRTILLSRFDGTSWSTPRTISKGAGDDAALKGTPTLARYLGGPKRERIDCLHLVVENAAQNDRSLWWTYSCGGGDFSVPVGIPGATTASGLAVAADASRLLLGSRTPKDMFLEFRSYSYPNSTRIDQGGGVLAPVLGR
jgi:hypothetical protein